MALDNLTSWLDTAVSGIRFGPDQRAVRAELAAHLEDKEADLRRIFPDIPDTEARDRALAGMGEAEEVKRELAKVHRPWLGYLWRLSQWVLAAALVLALFHGVSLDGLWVKPSDAWSETATVLEPAAERAELDGYTISMTGAALQEGEEGEWFAIMVLEQTAPRFWALDGQVLCTQTSAVDSLGNTYLSSWQWNRLTPEEITYPMRWVDGSHHRRTFFRRDLCLFVQWVDPAAEWLRLEYNWLGREFSMTVYLKEAGT